MHYGAVVGMVEMGNRNPECMCNLALFQTEPGTGLADLEHTRPDDRDAGLEARYPYRSDIAHVVRIGERKPDFFVRLAHRGRAEALVLVFCPAAGKRDIAGPGIPGATGAFHEAHAPGFGTAGKDNRHRCTPGRRHARGRFGIEEPAANLFDARHHTAKIPQ